MTHERAACQIIHPCFTPVPPFLIPGHSPSSRIGHLNVEYAGTRPLSEAKRVRDTIVLPWVTRLEGVLLILFFFFFF